MGKKRNKRPSDQYRLPPKVVAAQRSAARVAAFRPRPVVPQRRVVLALAGLFLVCAGLASVLWFPAHSLRDDLRSGGTTVAARVVGVDDKPKFVEVRLVQGPDEGTRVRLSEYAGMLPDVRTGDSLLVTYDPEEPSRVLPRGWVTDPPANLPAYGTAAIALLCLALATAVALRRRWILRTWPSEPAAAADAVGPEQPRTKGKGLPKS